MADQDDPLRYHVPRGLKRAFLIAAAILLLILITGTASRILAAHRLAAQAANSGIPTVAVISPTQPATGQTLTLPGNIKAFYEAPIYAQVSGYLEDWDADIGTKVKKGQTLATISTPDLDQQLAQAEANLNSAIAAEQIANTTAARWTKMRQGDAVSQQDADQKNADATSARAAVAAARAAVAGLQAQEGFKTITAPFDGIVTQRNTDIGALITTGGTSQTPLFVVDDESRLRLYVSVPQAYAAEVRQIKGADFTVPDYPGRIFHAALTTTAGAIDPASGTLLVQFQVDNAAGTLQPGGYAQVSISLPADTQALSVPASVLMFRDNGMEVATLGPGNRVIIRQVTIGKDLGKTVQLATGITANDKIIDNPPDSLAQGDLVEVAAAKQR